MKNRYELRVASLYEAMFPNDNHEISYFTKKQWITNELKKQFEQRVFKQEEKAVKKEREQNNFLKTKYIPNRRKKYLESINANIEEYNDSTKRNLVVFKGCEEVVEEQTGDDNRLVLEYSNAKYMKQFGHDIKQSILVNKTEAKEKDYTATFFTNTLLSRFQPFRTSRGDIKLPFAQWTVNPNFIYANLDEAISEGYLYLNSFLSAFLHKVKKNSRKHRKLAKEIKYNIILEPHRTLQVHSHGIIFHHPDLSDWIKECYERTLIEYNMPTATNDIKQNFGNIDGAIKYIVKYIQKNLQIANTLDDQERKHDWIEQQKTDINVYLGWKLMLGNGARLHRSSRNKLDKRTSRLIYRVCGDAEEYKNATLNQATDNATCLRYEINNDTAKRTIIQEEGKSDKIKDYNVKDKDNKRFHVLEVKRKIYKRFYQGRVIEIDKSEYDAKKKSSSKILGDDYRAQLSTVREQIEQLVKLPEELMINNDYTILSNLFKMESQLKKKIGIIDGLYSIYYKVEQLIITDMGEKILYDKNWYSI